MDMLSAKMLNDGLNHAYSSAIGYLATLRIFCDPLEPFCQHESLICEMLELYE